MAVPARGGPMQEVDHQAIGMCGERIIKDPHRRQHRQLAIRTVKLVAPDYGAYAFGFEHAFDQVCFGRMFCGMHELHVEVSLCPELRRCQLNGA